ncbi:hypothetical protein BCR42DRAFT_442075 [Absidia repens]|uniref:Nitrogen regulatory protein areA GATA-like domain-containing protein n=1 Tax=Absidia repens TaxID=90262 RepID=A0A1X2I3Q4_9FUNG|nr:hypothetical protein BCR42DRAFT_442075 [Absidia repens]
MLQRLDINMQSLNDTTTNIHADYFPSIASVLKKCKNSLENDCRLEHFNWVLWRRASTQSTASTDRSSLSMGESWSNCNYDSSSCSFSSSSSPSTFINASLNKTVSDINHQSASPCSNLSRRQEENKRTPKFFKSDIEKPNAHHHEIQTWSTENHHRQIIIHDDDNNNDDNNDDDESTLFGDDETENTDSPSGMVGVSYGPCYEFTKKQAPIVDQKSLLSNMLLHDSPAFTSKTMKSSLSMFIPAPSTTSSISSTDTLLTLIDDDVLSSSMKQHVDWEKIQNRGPAAGLTGTSKKEQGSSNPASSMTLVYGTLDTFTGCW